MTHLENKNTIEMHGCIVCARTFTVLAVYASDGKLVGCTVTSSSDGHCVANERQPLVACNFHSTEEIEAAYKRWQSRNDQEEDE